jgi:iron complex transport system ATP-binding protein
MNGPATTPLSTVTIRCQGLCVGFRGRAALEEVSLTVAPGRLTALLGANGAGKTSLLRALGGLLAPMGGRLQWLTGSTPLDAALTRSGRLIAFVPQDRQVHWPMAVRHVVALGRLPHRAVGRAGAERDRAAVDGAMAALDVARLADRSIGEISGGERARVLIARALAQETPVLLADEPAAGLDPAHQLDLFERLSGLAHAGRTVVVALHDLSAAARFADEVIVLGKFRVLANGPPATVLTTATLAAAFGIEAERVVINGLPFVLPRARLP